MITADLIEKLHKPVPRYTSYPTAPVWGPLSPSTYAEKLHELSSSLDPLSLYFHIPFCKTMCLFCGCSVILNRNEENERCYVDALLQEISLVKQALGNKKTVTQLHFGGGTPTKLSQELLEILFKGILEAFHIDFSKEVAIEIDPRTVFSDEGKKLRFLRSLGFNRVSFGVQDTDPKVQKAIARNQSLEMTQKTVEWARLLQFDGINLDLIYGLPFQTKESFRQTIADIIALQPDRIALFSYAKIPWLKPHQKAIDEKTLPSTHEKFAIYVEARKALTEAGYIAIGMDHFARAQDALAMSYRTKTLQRNFQGYSLSLAEEALGFGVTAIGCARSTYFQNHKELVTYYAALNRGEFPVHRGKTLSLEDRKRKWVIQSLMCNFEVDKNRFEKQFLTPFDSYFKTELEILSHEDLVVLTKDKIVVTPEGELFIRNIAAVFDAYLSPTAQQFSQSI